ncbi:hypothetical protein A8C56_04795 [Niabella ginsenosidivorans]|uniref:Phage protein D n=1 Tax=Niabella ginsenosidivorans TaxID=1176587 RepID=A0A1A9I0Z2_9BACT|nr:hypothetical protein [Niabella ginsenosidivorans]ANH80390.1 hypothetical protein A8C56_04795 [Niabella ginsenosidivorans]
MLKGKISIAIFIGTPVPVPVPNPVIEALSSVEVNTDTGSASGFQLVFNFDSKSPLNTLLLLVGQTGPFVRVIIQATINGTDSVLMDGMITNHQLTPNVQTGESVFTISGRDLTSVMDYIDFSGLPYPCMPPETRVLLILAKYAVFGIIPMVIPSIFPDIPIVTEQIPSQQGKDLEYITQLATENGYVFYIEPGPVVGTNVAYWGPELKVGVPQKALNINMDAYTNITSLNFSFDDSNKSMPIVYIQNQQTRAPIPVPIPDINPLQPPLGLIPPIPVQFNKMTDTAKLNPVQALARGVAEASSSSDAVTGTGSLDVVRYGAVLKARSLVGVRGAGDAFDGLYFVKSVKHKIQRGTYTQDFTLTRNGLVSTLPVVPA